MRSSFGREKRIVQCYNCNQVGHIVPEWSYKNDGDDDYDHVNLVEAYNKVSDESTLLFVQN